MTIHPLWSDQYWPLLLQLYLRSPMGVKPLYSRGLVGLSLELHIPPKYLYEAMFKLRERATPAIKALWEHYADRPRRLAHDVQQLRDMKGFNRADVFYKGVEMAESFENDFYPLAEQPLLTPVKLIMILDLYFRLTPITMVADTPEVVTLGRLLKIPATLVAEVMGVFQFCDPYLNRDNALIHPLLEPCQAIWQRYGNDNPQQLSSLAALLRTYFER